MTDQAVVQGMRQGNQGQPQNPGKGRPSNWRTALVLLSIALVFFVGVIVNRLLFN